MHKVRGFVAQRPLYRKGTRTLDGRGKQDGGTGKYLCVPEEELEAISVPSDLYIVPYLFLSHKDHRAVHKERKSSIMCSAVTALLLCDQFLGFHRASRMGFEEGVMV